MRGKNAAMTCAEVVLSAALLAAHSRAIAPRLVHSAAGSVGTKGSGDADLDDLGGFDADDDGALDLDLGKVDLDADDPCQIESISPLAEGACCLKLRYKLRSRKD